MSASPGKCHVGILFWWEKLKAQKGQVGEQGQGDEPGVLGETKVHSNHYLDP